MAMRVHICGKTSHFKWAWDIRHDWCVIIVSIAIKNKKQQQKPTAERVIRPICSMWIESIKWFWYLAALRLLIHILNDNWTGELKLKLLSIRCHSEIEFKCLQSRFFMSEILFLFQLKWMWVDYSPWLRCSEHEKQNTNWNKIPKSKKNTFHHFRDIYPFAFPFCNDVASASASALLSYIMYQVNIAFCVCIITIFFA